MSLAGAYAKHSRAILKKLLSYKPKKQFIFAGATIPTAGKKNVRQFLSHYFQHATWIIGDEFHIHRSNLNIEWIYIKKTIDVIHPSILKSDTNQAYLIEQQKILQHEEKLSYVSQYIKQFMNQKNKL